jgi:hypothetical protein
VGEEEMAVVGTGDATLVRQRRATPGGRAECGRGHSQRRYSTKLSSFPIRTGSR